MLSVDTSLAAALVRPLLSLMMTSQGSQCRLSMQCYSTRRLCGETSGNKAVCDFPKSVLVTALFFSLLQVFYPTSLYVACVISAFVDIAGSTSDPQAFELERRTIQSLYLMRSQEAGSMPPQESGLLYNSWTGKHHSEVR